MQRLATCNCGQLGAACRGEPVRISICHCLNCKRRTGSAIAWNASFPTHAVATVGEHHTYARPTESGRTNIYHFCPRCGSTVFYHVEMRPGTISIPAGAFADAAFSGPVVELYEERRVAWCSLDL